MKPRYEKYLLGLACMILRSMYAQFEHKQNRGNIKPPTKQEHTVLCSKTCGGNKDFVVLRNDKLYWILP